ncbi:hypothetical protein BOX15_Mlig016144g1 [Macrostomum lignano]|uniref:Uncharacterized protein n=1 Tax=Macrostomum lignano TaxID=282301 RepID=A0A267G3D0_9PLAT|nr:hypothetical protein BOX15_Mlig016144g1 [Macrostomum lignano]
MRSTPPARRWPADMPTAARRPRKRSCVGLGGPNGCQSFHGCLERFQCSSCYRDPDTGREECCDSQCVGGCSGRPEACSACRGVRLMASANGTYLCEKVRQEFVNWLGRSVLLTPEPAK